MRLERTTAPPADRSRSAIARAFACVDLEYTKRAAMCLKTAQEIGVGDARFRFLHATAEMLIARRDFTALPDVIQDLKASARTNDEHAWSIVVEAHLSALVGHARSAIRLATQASRLQRDRYTVIRARILVVAGLACYRSGHYRWARA